MHATKEATAINVKAGDDAGLDVGEFEAIVSVFGNVDSDGDRVVKGAFAKTLADWRDRDAPLPVIFSHEHRDPMAHIGVVLDAKETDEGLWVRGKLDLDTDYSRKAYSLLKGNRLRNWSYAYEIEDSKQADDGANELLELTLHEVGPTLVGSNRDTQTLVVKSNSNATAGTTLTFDPPLKLTTTNTTADVLLSTKVSDTPWSKFSQSDYSDEQWQRACVLDRGADAGGTAKQRYALPVREPGGALNRNGVHSAAGALAGSRGGVTASPEAKRSAARKLLSLYKQIGDEPPDSLVNLGKQAAVVLNALLDEDPALVDYLKSIISEHTKAMTHDAETALRAAYDALGDALKALHTDAQAAASDASDGKPEDPDTGNGEDRSARPSARVRAAQTQLLLEGSQHADSNAD